MPTIVLPPPPPAAVRPAYHFGVSADELQPLGSEGRMLSKALRAVVTHWNEQTTLLMPLADDADVTYQPVPFRATFVVKTQYRYVGRLLPCQFTVDD